MSEQAFSRTEQLLGAEALSRLANVRVAVFGIGGVGGYAAEALARSGVGALDLVDNDTVSVTNLNRQIVALHSTLGQYKVDVMKARIADISPQTTVTTHRLFFLPENADVFDFSVYDYVVDAVDTVSAKLAIIEKAVEKSVPVISCMGTGNKLDPTALTVTDIAKTNGCPLARVMRRELRARGISHVPVVFSNEPPHRATIAEQDPLSGKVPPASAVFVPATAGLLLARQVVSELCKE
jgi:tRNA A37 threonylcarbamoyladenosine dehydratase